MGIYRFAGALAPALALAACGAVPSEAGEKGAARVPAASDRQVYQAEGTVTGVENGQLSISHGPVAELGWPAMTMSFVVPSPEVAHGIITGDRVRFAFRAATDGYALTSLRKAP